MCRTVHALLTVVICGVQMLVRVFMTLILMIENVIRMFLQTLYNFISFLLQLISLIPICCVFFATSRLKCFMCGGGGPCPVRRGGGCDCLMSAVAIIILFFIFRATGVLDKIFYSIGYAKAAKHVVKYSPTPGTITECSRNDSFVTNATTTQMTTGNSEIIYDVDDATSINSEMNNYTIVEDTINSEINNDITEDTNTKPDATDVDSNIADQSGDVINSNGTALAQNDGKEPQNPIPDTSNTDENETETKTSTSSESTTGTTASTKASTSSKPTTSTSSELTTEPTASISPELTTEPTESSKPSRSSEPSTEATASTKSSTSPEPTTSISSEPTTEKSKEASEETSEEISKETSEVTNEETSEETSEKTSEETSEETSEKTSEEAKEENSPEINRRIGDDDHDQIDDETQSNTTKIDEEDTVILYYDDDTQISDNNLTASKNIANDVSRENEMEEEEVVHHVSNSKISSKATRSSQDKNYQNSKLIGWLGSTSISYYMV